MHNSSMVTVVKELIAVIHALVPIMLALCLILLIPIMPKIMLA